VYRTFAPFYNKKKEQKSNALFDVRLSTIRGKDKRVQKLILRG